MRRSYTKSHADLHRFGSRGQQDGRCLSIYDDARYDPSFWLGHLEGHFVRKIPLCLARCHVRSTIARPSFSISCLSLRQQFCLQRGLSRVIDTEDRARNALFSPCGSVFRLDGYLCSVSHLTKAKFAMASGSIHFKCLAKPDVSRKENPSPDVIEGRILKIRIKTNTASRYRGWMTLLLVLFAGSNVENRKTIPA